MDGMGKLLTLTLLSLWTALQGKSGTLVEDFALDPKSSGWSVFGAADLFRWDATNQSLHVTWDSSRTNSYFCRSLGTILTSEDNFQLSFDLTFEDYASGTTAGKAGAFEAAIGLLNLDQAMSPSFSRGAGRNATYGPRNLVEFNFFPAFGSFLPTIAQVIVGTNYTDWFFNHDNLQPMAPGQTFSVVMLYSAQTRTLTTTVSNNATQYGPTQEILVPANVDFRVATLSISSYSDVRSLDSLLAHGSVDNIRLVVPPPPVLDLVGNFKAGEWTVQFLSRDHWLYDMERSTNDEIWSTVTTKTLGTGDWMFLTDSSPPTSLARYRVRSQRP